MIQARLIRNKAGQWSAFSVVNHGESYVCAAVSMLVINTINSIKALTKAQFDCNVDEASACISFELITPRSQPGGHDAGLLLDALAIGLASVADQYPHDLLLHKQNFNESKESE